MLRPALTPAALLLVGSVSFAQTPLEGLVPAASNARQIAQRMTMALPPAPIVGSDTCATPTLVVGNGPHAFDTVGATTGPEGQSTVNCIFANQIGIDSDVWFEWVAPTTGSFELTTCGLSVVDTKIAVYAGTAGGTTCPPGGGAASDCSDDINIAAFPFKLQTRVTFPTTAGTHYLIQIGGYPGTPPFTTDPPAPQGNGQFQLDAVVFQPPFTRHDGSAEQAYRLVAPTVETLWMMEQGDTTTGQLNVTEVKAAAGALIAVGQSGVLNGNPIRLGVWEDPNDDGNPNDAVLLSEFASTVSQADTDVPVRYALPTPVQVDGIFFVGAAYVHGSGTGFPAPSDHNGCNARPAQAYLAGNSGVVDFTTLGANTVAPFAVGGTFPGAGIAFLIEATTTSAGAGTVFCIGDGVTPHTACPCANNSATADGVGCLSSLGFGGKLRASGGSSISADTLVLTGSQMPSSSCLYFQGTTQQNAGNGSLFGDGLRCAGGVIVRLGTKTNVAGTSQYPAGADLPVSVKGNVTVPGTRTYQAWYRNAAAFCLPATFNLTNGLEIIWGS